MVEEELDETLYWLELITESGLIKANLLDDLINENNELKKIIVSSILTMRKRIKSNKNGNNPLDKSDKS